MTNELEQMVSTMLWYKDEYSKQDYYEDKTYDELMGMINACIRVNPTVGELVNRYYDKEQAENDTESVLELRLDSLSLALESNNIGEILDECKCLIKFAIDDLPEFFADEPLEDVMSNELKQLVDTRRYLLTWDYENTIGKVEPEIYTVDMFRDNNGFTTEDINQIIMLDMNEERIIDNVTVRRIR